MRVLFLGSYDRESERNRIFIDGLRKQGVVVLERHFPMEGLRFRGTGAAMAAGLARAALSIPGYLAHMVTGAGAASGADVVLVGYLGHHDIAILAALRRAVRALRERPLVFDPFFSLYDTIVSDRALLRPQSGAARALRRAEQWVLRGADLILADTAAHAAYYQALAGLPAERLRVVPVGADERLFPRHDPRPPREELRVLFYGTYIPLHGVQTILEAADVLRAESIRFRLIGRGQTRHSADELARNRGLTRVEFVDWVPLTQLASEIAEADVVLGIFGTSGKAARVVPNKVYQAMSVGRCVVTRDSPALREMFIPGEHLATCVAGDARDLASVLRELQRDHGLRHRLAEAGHAIARSRFSTAAIGQILRDVLSQIVGGRRLA
jgi:glycosyltransferase involved in cell wall biosynthesis